MKMQVLLVLILASGCTVMKSETELTSLENEVRATETAFAKTMADRNFEGFVSFLAEDAIFFAGGEPLRGSAAVSAGWKPFFDRADAPFSWSPAVVAAQAGGRLALSSGPVFDAKGKQIGVFNSIWRREKSGAWKIVFDKGGSYCPPGSD